MSITEVLFISISLAMDAFAVSICKGLSMKKINWKKALIIALYFGMLLEIQWVFQQQNLKMMLQ